MKYKCFNRAQNEKENDLSRPPGSAFRFPPCRFPRTLIQPHQTQGGLAMSLSSKFKATKPHISRIQHAGMRYRYLASSNSSLLWPSKNGKPGIYYTYIAFTVLKKEV